MKTNIYNNICHGMVLTITVVVAGITLVACSSDDSASADNTSRISVSAELQGMGSISRSTITRATESTLLTSEQSPAYGEITDLSTLYKEDGEIISGFICPAMTGYENSYFSGSLENGATPTWHKELPPSDDNAFTPYITNINKATAYDNAWAYIMHHKDDIVMGESARNGSDYAFKFSHKMAKISVVLNDRQGDALGDEYFASSNPNENIQVSLIYADLDYIWAYDISGTLKTGTLTDDEWSSVQNMNYVVYGKGNGGTVTKEMQRPADFSTPQEGYKYMTNLFNAIIIPQQMDNTEGKCYKKNEDGTLTKDACKYTSNAYLTIKIPSTLSGTGKDETYILNCSDIKLDNETSDGRTALSELKSGEHAMINVSIDPLVGIVSDNIAIASWYDDCNIFDTIGENSTEDAQILNFPDRKFRQALVNTYKFKLNATGNDIDMTDADNINKMDTLKTLKISNLKISNIKGIEHFKALETLNCRFNQLTSINVTQNSKLKYLDCNNNQLSSLDVTQNSKLEELDCANNQLSSLDVTQNSELIGIQCGYNQLTTLNVIHNSKLNVLYCSDNQLTSINVTKNPELEYFGIGSNLLTSLDVTQNSKLSYLHCEGNQLTSIDVTNNTKLLNFGCNSNRLSSLDATHMTSYKNGFYFLICGDQTSDGTTAKTLTLTLTSTMQKKWDSFLTNYDDNTNVKVVVKD